MEDCAICVEYPAIECDGKVIFKGKDENGCPLEPICLEEEKVCRTDDECAQPLCGVASCVMEGEESVGECKITELEECKEAECVDGEERIVTCETGEELTVKICEEGLWKSTGVECAGKIGLECVQCGNSCVSQEEIATMMCTETTEEFDCIEKSGQCVSSELEEEHILGNECETVGDCGGARKKRLLLKKNNQKNQILMKKQKKQVLQEELYLASLEV
jgi:hypothetical protein